MQGRRCGGPVMPKSKLKNVRAEGRTTKDPELLSERALRIALQRKLEQDPHYLENLKPGDQISIEVTAEDIKNAQS